jgi:starch phosphorylase
MEIGLDESIPTYSGGLGLLTGDLAYSFADLGVPATFVTLLSRNGYTSQTLDPNAGQRDTPQPWDWQRLLVDTGVTVDVEIGDRAQKVGAWERRLEGKTETSILFLNTDYQENQQEVRDATDRLYGGRPTTRLIQDMVLGVGGYRILSTLGRKVQIYHLNESHAAFATVELLRDLGGPEGVRKHCVFTTHTPVAAGNDTFPIASVRDAFRKYGWMNWDAEASDGSINLSKLAEKYSGVTNAVSLKHRFVSNGVLGHDGITFVTNGVYHRRWVHPELGAVYDRHIRGWETMPSLLARANAIPTEELWKAHTAVKGALVQAVNQQTNIGFNDESLIVTVAKRFTAYKRNTMILSDPGRLMKISSERGEIQIILAGKAHPMDGPAKAMISDAIQKAALLKRDSKSVRVAVMENYDIDMAKLLVAGSDVWLNNPRRPLEACGTSGMKAGMNGVLNLSVYDGWWLEGGIDGLNGWGIGRRADWGDIGGPAEGEDENDLYVKLADSVLPTFYGKRERWVEMSKASIATIGPHFNSYRMLEDYVTKVYARVSAPS